MNIQILEQTTDNGNHYFTMASDKKEVYLSADKHGTVNVCVQNAAHQVFRGSGKFFYGEKAWKEALNAYKSADVKAMIEFAYSEVVGAEVVEVGGSH